jgi:DNA-binding SARP family transcriptional activator
MRSTLELARQLVEGGRYAEAQALLRSVEPTGSAGGPEDGGVLASAADMCVGCRTSHEQTLVHWRVAADSALIESRMRSDLIVLLTRAIGLVDREPGAAAPDGANALVVRCLGPLEVRYRGRPLGPFTNRRARSVFEYLLVHRGRITAKELLMELLWPDSTPSVARNNLNVAVHGLRRFLRQAGDRGGLVRFQDGGYVLRADAEMWLDLDEFDRHVTVARIGDSARDGIAAVRDLEAAAALYRGELFADEPYADWIAGPRRAVADRHVAVLQALIEHYDRVRDDESCVRACGRVLELQPADESTHRALMRCYARMGQRHLALRQFRDCAAVLRSEFDVAPDVETVRLFHRVRTHRPLDPTSA